MKNITRKQAITLVVLVCVLFIVIAVQYFYRPVLKKKSELQEKVESMELVAEDMKMLAAYYSIDAISYKEMKEELAKKRSEFLPLMKNSQQDDMITNMLVSSNISIESSNISELQKETVRVSCAVDSGNEDSVDGYSSLAMYPEGGKVISGDDSYVTLEYETGEYSREIYYSVSGKYEDIIGFLKKVYTQKSMEISRFYFNSGDLNQMIAVEEPANEETAEDNADGEEGEGSSLPTIGSVKKTEKIISNSVYKAGIGVKVHMYDRDFDLVSRTDY